MYLHDDAAYRPRIHRRGVHRSTHAQLGRAVPVRVRVSVRVRVGVGVRVRVSVRVGVRVRASAVCKEDRAALLAG